MYMRALAGYEKVLGPDHKSTLNTAYNLRALYFQQEQRADGCLLLEGARAG